MARFILELRRDDISDPSPVVQEWILDTNKADSTADFVVPFAVAKPGYVVPESGYIGALGDFAEQINRAVVVAGPRDPQDDAPLSPTDALLARAGMRLRDRKERE